MDYQSIEQIVKNSSAEQKIVWNEIFLRFGERCAVLPLSYIGIGTSAPYVMWRPRQIYFAYKWEQSVNSVSASQITITLYDENNNTIYTASNSSAYWNTTTAAVNFNPNVILLENLWFGRLAQSANYHRFIGYKIVF